MLRNFEGLMEKGKASVRRRSSGRHVAELGFELGFTAAREADHEEDHAGKDGQDQQDHEEDRPAGGVGMVLEALGASGAGEKGVHCRSEDDVAGLLVEIDAVNWHR